MSENRGLEVFEESREYFGRRELANTWQWHVLGVVFGLFASKVTGKVNYRAARKVVRTAPDFDYVNILRKLYIFPGSVSL